MNREDVFHWLGSDAGRAAIAGALGGVVRWITLRERPKEALGSLVVGSVCAIYLGPLVEPIMEPVIGKIAPNGDPAGFASFVVGLGGISIASFVIEIFRAKNKADDNDKA
ncbi:MAG: hypothetical protein EP341_05445 [Sphingomonadales bacterium]|nr:MAG: hypothetical protein EP341_05445 [Sphingomonadales bacterium]